MPTAMQAAVHPAPHVRGLTVLGASFALFNGLRVVAYLPTLSAIQTSGQADQHSLITWLTFVGANATMAVWLHEQNGRRMNLAVAVNACNALMCGAVAASIAWLRWSSPSAVLSSFFS